MCVVWTESKVFWLVCAFYGLADGSMRHMLTIIMFGFVNSFTGSVSGPW